MIVTETNRITYELSEAELLDLISSDAHLDIPRTTDGEEGDSMETPVAIYYDVLCRVYRISVGGTTEREA